MDRLTNWFRNLWLWNLPSRLTNWFSNLLQWNELSMVLNKNKGPYFLWSTGNLGGLLVAYLASVQIWINQSAKSALLPGPEAYLITGTISLAMAGVSCLSFKRRGNVTLSPFISFSWAFPLMLIYGQLVILGMPNNATEAWKSWSIAIAALVISFAWASLTWLHEQGLRMDMDQEVKIPDEPPKDLTQSAEGLPKLPS